MVDIGMTRNDKKVIQRYGHLAGITHLKVETATNVKPGRFVKKDTTDAQVEVCGAGGNPLGIAGFEETPARYQPLTIDTAYSANDEIAVHFGSGFLFRGYLASGENVAAGAFLCIGANGELVAATAAAPPSGSTAVTSTSAQPTMAGALSSQGKIVAKAMESVDASGGALPILCQSMGF